MDQERLASPPPARAWTRPDDYVEALARRRTARKAREPRGRTQPEAPRFSLSTLPFLALLCAMAVLAFAIAVAALPVSHERKAQTAQAERGTAAKGWFQEAQKEFHR